MRDEPTLVETGPGTSVEPVARALDELGIAPDALAHIVLTHIHLDHAGGVGALAARFPRATVWVHERGARHLADPSRLVSSATRVYGEERMASLFGPVEPVPAERLRVLEDQQLLDIGGRSLLALDTPGHASHHLALVDSSTGVVFTGDALGIHVPDLPVLRPATPPPEFDLELAVASIERIRAAAALHPAVRALRADRRRRSHVRPRRAPAERVDRRRPRRDAVDDGSRRDRRGALTRGRPRDRHRRRGATRPRSVGDARRHPDERHRASRGTSRSGPSRSRERERASDPQAS